MSSFPITVRTIIQETADAATLIFEKPHPRFLYRPGQFITLLLSIGGKEVRRCYSFSSSPYIDAHPSITVKKVPLGRASVYLCDHVYEGQRLNALPPAGNFTLRELGLPTHHYTFIAGGSGIVPIFSMLKTVLLTDPNKRVTLIYANRNEQSIIFRRQLEELQKEYGERFELYHLLSQPSPQWQGDQGRLDASLLYAILGRKPSRRYEFDHYWMCGPFGLMKVVTQALQEIKVPPVQIRQEFYGSTQEENYSVPFYYTLEVDYLGHRYTSTAYTKNTLLASMLQQGIDMPYACMSGTCNTCRARCLEGEVIMKEDEGLTKEELKQGYVLTCVSHSKSKKVRLSVE